MFAHLAEKKRFGTFLDDFRAYVYNQVAILGVAHCQILSFCPIEMFVTCKRIYKKFPETFILIVFGLSIFLDKLKLSRRITIRR